MKPPQEIKREIPLPPKKEPIPPSTPPTEAIGPTGQGSLDKPSNALGPPSEKDRPQLPQLTQTEPKEIAAESGPRAKLPEELRGSVFKRFEAPVDIHEIESLFEQTKIELNALEELSAVELTQEYLRNEGKDGAIEALFDLAYEVVEHPERELQLVEKFTTSEQRQVESHSLAGELAKVEKKMSLPVFGLRSIKARVASARKAEGEEPVRELSPAAISQRLKASAIDLMATMFLAAVMVALLSAFIDKAFYRELGTVLRGSEASQISALMLTIAWTTVLLAVYPLMSLLVSNHTLGQLLCRIRVTTELGKKPRLSHIVVRSLLFPMSLFFFGYLPVLAGRRSLHDALARTKVCQL